MNDYFPVVVQVIPKKDYTVYVYFDDGKIVLYDLSEKLDKEIFKPLRNIDTFMNSCTVMNETLAWDIEGNRDETKCIDIDPCALYELSSIEEKIA